MINTVARKSFVFHLIAFGYLILILFDFICRIKFWTHGQRFKYSTPQNVIYLIMIENSIQGQRKSARNNGPDVLWTLCQCFKYSAILRNITYLNMIENSIRPLCKLVFPAMTLCSALIMLIHHVHPNTGRYVVIVSACVFHFIRYKNDCKLKC